MAGLFRFFDHSFYHYKKTLYIPIEKAKEKQNLWRFYKIMCLLNAVVS